MKKTKVVTKKKKVAVKSKPKVKVYKK